MTTTSGEGPPPSSPGRWRRHTRWLRPSTLGLGLVLFALPFVAVSCDTPGGFGRVSPGGTTSWSGYQLATGADTSRTTENLLPSADAASDHIGLQPLVTASLVLLIAAVVVGLVVPQVQRRRLLSFWLVAATLATMITGVVIASQQVIALVADQLAGRELPDDRTPDSYVSVQGGFWAFVILLAAVLVVDLALWQSARRRPGRAAPPSPAR